MSSSIIVLTVVSLSPPQLVAVMRNVPHSFSLSSRTYRLISLLQQLLCTAELSLAAQIGASLLSIMQHVQSD